MKSVNAREAPAVPDTELGTVAKSGRENQCSLASGSKQTLGLA